MANLDSSIPATAQHEPVYRRNFFFFLVDNILFSLAMGIIGPTTLIPDFIRHLTRSEVLIGLSSSLFEVGWTLPQLAIAQLISGYARKKWWFVGPNIPVRFVMLIFAGLTVWLGRDRPIAILVAFLICYSIAAIGDGLVGIPWVDLAGTSLDARWRARMFGWSLAGSGLIMLAITPLVGFILGPAGLAFPNNYALIFGLAGALFVISILPVIFVHELPGARVDEQRLSLGELFARLKTILRTDAQFRAILITRMLTSLYAMAGPFYIGFVTEKLGLSSTVAVPVLLAMQTVGSVSGALFYSWLGARNNLLYIRLALGAAAFLPVSALLARLVGPLPLYFGFLIGGLTLGNLFNGYLNWVISHPSPEQRPLYAGLFNTISAVVSLAAPFIAGTVAQEIGFEALFGLALVMVLAALAVTGRFVRSARSGGSPEIAATS